MVDRLADDLARHGIDAWLSFRNISPAQRWQDEIGDALARCKWFLVWLTANAVASRWVKEEVHYAFNDDRLAGRIIPLLRTDCAWKKLHFALGNRQMINFRNYDKGMQELLRVWGIESQPRQ